jgi:hypothetical protein
MHCRSLLSLLKPGHAYFRLKDCQPEHNEWNICKRIKKKKGSWKIGEGRLSLSIKGAPFFLWASYVWCVVISVYCNQLWPHNLPNIYVKSQAHILEVEKIIMHYFGPPTRYRWLMYVTNSRWMIFFTKVVNVLNQIISIFPENN